MRTLTLVLCVVFASLSGSALAAESRKELGLRMDALTQRVIALEERLLTGDPAAIQLQQRLDELERQLRMQVGENERLRFENIRQREDINSLRKELDLLNSDVQTARKDAQAAKRLLGGYIAASAGGSVLAEPVTAGGETPQDTEMASDAMPVEPQMDPASAEARFSEARRVLENGFFDEAYTALQAFVSDFPEHALSGEALYWLGEIQMVRGNPEVAAEQYLQSLKNFRKGERAPDAMVKLAAAFAAIGDNDEACRTLKLFPREYPKANSSVKTKADIEMRRAGCTP